MSRTRFVSSLVLILVALPSCSLIIDTNPDGVIYSGGASSRAGAGGGGRTGSGGTSAIGGASGATASVGGAAGVSITPSGAGSASIAGGTSAGGAGGGGALIGGAGAGGGAISSGGASSGGTSTNASAGGPGVTGGTQATGGVAKAGGTTSAAGSSSVGGATNLGGSAGTSGAGPCGAGTQQCKGNVPQLCSSAGVWQDQTACSGSTPTCSGGACICTAGTLQCKTDGITPQFCASTGVWQDRTACSGATPVCNGAGVCGACQATLRKCDKATPMVCSAAGVWEAQTVCSGTTPFCAGGACTATCPGNGGPTMKLLPEGYCIDTTEVTREQYQTWLASGAAAKPASQISNCAWNDSYLPGTDARNDWPPGMNITAPITFIDWCDAYAYCAGVGKRLCGKIGGGAIGPSEVTADPSASQWVNACSSHGVNDYNCGDTYVEGTCNSTNVDGGSNFVASMPGCQSPVPAYSGIYDLGGNVQEFIDSCDSTPGMAANCDTRGGSFWFWDTQMMCTAGYAVRRDRREAWIGVRCCSP